MGQSMSEGDPHVERPGTYQDSIVAHAEGDYSVAANEIHPEPVIAGWVFWAIIIGLDLLFLITGLTIAALRLGLSS